MARPGCRSTMPLPSRISRSPDLVDVAAYSVQVDTGNGPARGRTVCDGLRSGGSSGRAAPLNAQVGIRIDRDRFEDILVDAYPRLP